MGTRSIVLLGLAVLSARASAQAPLCEGAASFGAPQVADAQAFYDAATARDLERFEGVLVCRVAVADRSLDGRGRHGPVRHAFGVPDLAVLVALPGRREPVRIRGAEDTHAVIFSIPGVVLGHGDRMRVVVRDRDVVTEDLLARLDLVFAGTTAMTEAVDQVTVSCRGVPGSELGPRADEAFARAARELEALDALVPDLDAPGRAGPTDALARAAASICAYAALVSGTDLRLAGLRSEYAGRARALEARVADALARIDRSAGDAIDSLGDAGLAVRVLEHGCDRAALGRLVRDPPPGDACFVRFEVVATTRSEAAFTVDVVSTQGDGIAASASLELASPRPRAVRRYRFGAGTTSLAIVVPTRAGRFLRVRSGATTAFLRLPPA